MKEIKLTRGFVALVDDEDYDYFNQWKWFYCNGYAARQIRREKKQETCYMHKCILNRLLPFRCFRINGNGLDNRRSNLKKCITDGNRIRKHPSIRKDAEVRARVNYHFLDKLKDLAAKRKIPLSTLIIESLQKVLEEQSVNKS